MKPRYFIHRMLTGTALALAVFTLATGTHAGTVTKAATGTDLTNGASWAGTPPGSSDTATWVSTSLGTGLTLGSDSSWQAISMAGLLTDIDITGTGKITLGSGGTSGAVVPGISVSAVNLTLAAPVAVNVNTTVHQTWTANAGKSIYASGLISGAGRLYKLGIGSALVLSNPANSFSDLKIDEGIVRITNAGAIGSNKTVAMATTKAQLELDGSGGNITLPSGINFSTSNPYCNIRNSAGDNRINGNITMSSGGGGTKIRSDGGTLVLAGTVTNGASARSFDLGGTATGANTFSGVLNNGGTPGLIKSDAGTWILTGSNTYTGATAVNDGIMQLSGANGAITATASCSLNGGSLILDNTATAGGNKADRIANASTLSINGGSLVYKGSDTVSSTESLGAVTSKGNNFVTGNSAVTVTFGDTNAATLTAASLVHTAGNAAFLVNGVNLGMDTASTASVARLILTTPPTLVGTTVDAGTGINAASQNTQIVPYLVGEATPDTGGLGAATGTANTFGTYTAGSGFRPLNPTDEFTQNAILTGNNTRITAATTATATDSINSLVIAGNDLTISDGNTLTATSGAVLFASANAIKPSSSSGILDCGSAEGMLTVNPGLTSSVSAVIAGSGGITKSGAGTLALSNTNIYSGVTTLSGGVLKLDGAGALPGGIASTGGTSGLTFLGGVLGLANGNFTRGLAAAGTVDKCTFTGPGGWAAYGADRLVNLGGASAAITTGTAGTGFNAQMLILGAADATHMVTLQNPLTQSGTYTIRVIDGAAPIDATLSGAVTGSGSFLKAGAGTLALNGTNTYAGGPSVVMAGTLLVNGSTAAGDTVVVQNGATLGGAGTINGVAVLSTGATLQPTVTGTPGTLTFSNATPPAFFPGTTLKIRATSPTTLDKVSLTNAASVFTCGNLDLVFDCSSLSSAALNQTIVQTTNAAGISGTFHSVTATNGYTAILTYNANSITVVLSSAAGVPATLEVAGFPNPQTAGVAGSVTVTAKDVSGNPATGYTGTVYFTSSDLVAGLPTNYTFVPGNGGSHTFTGVMLNTPGTQSITATDTVTGTITGSQTGITITASPAKEMLAYTSTVGGSATISGTNVSLIVPIGTEVTGLAPTYTVSPLASCLPASGSALVSNPQDYTVTAQDGTTQVYTVTVTASDPPIDFSWANATSGNWSVGGNWTNEVALASLVAAGQANYKLSFNQSGTYAATNNLSDGFLLNQLNFGAATGAVTLDDTNAIALTANGPTLPSIHQNSTATVTIKSPVSLAGDTTFGGSGTGQVVLSGVISGAGGITKNGAGLLVINNASNTNSGGIIINNGTLQSLVVASGGLGTGPVTIQSGATLRFDGAGPNVTNHGIFNGGTIIAANGFGASWSGPVTLNSNTTVQAVYGMSFTNIITGSGGLIKTDGGTLTLGAANTFNGAMAVNVGTLKLGASGSINDTTNLTLAANTTFDVSAINSYILSSTTTLSASGTANAVTIKGKSGGTVSLGTQPIHLSFTPTTLSGDVARPALKVSQGALVLDNNTLTVNNAASTPLGAGVYRLIQVGDGSSGTITGIPDTAPVTVTGTGLAPGMAATVSVSSGNVILTVASADPYVLWSNGNFANPLTDKTPEGDPDNDTLTNLQEYAFGTDPTVSTTGEIVYDGTSVTTPGGPKIVEEGGMYYAVFGRRADYLTAGILYTVRFSADLENGYWVTSADEPEPITATGDIRAVRVPYPGLIDSASGPQKARFFEVGVSQTTP